MKVFDVWLRKILRLEGGFVCHPNDRGGATNKGITLAVFKEFFGYAMDVDDLRNITDDQAGKIYRELYWDKVRADDIECGAVAYLLADFAVNSGVKTAVKAVQRIVGVEDDGIMGRITLGAVNAAGEGLFHELKEYRKGYYMKIVDKHPEQRVFLKGWMNRLEEYRL